MIKSVDPRERNLTQMKTVDDTTFEEVVLKSRKLVFVDIWAPWCPPCRALGPIVEKFAVDNPSIEVVKINVDDAEAVAEAYDIRAVPTLLVFKDGQEIKRHVGGAPQSVMQEMIK